MSRHVHRIGSQPEIRTADEYGERVVYFCACGARRVVTYDLDGRILDRSAWSHPERETAS